MIYSSNSSHFNRKPFLGDELIGANRLVKKKTIAKSFDDGLAVTRTARN
jgi:hypothetical protein